VPHRINRRDAVKSMAGLAATLSPLAGCSSSGLEKSGGDPAPAGDKPAGIVDLGKMFRQGSLSPERVTEELLARIERENGRLNAFYEVFDKEARGAAAAAARELREGRDRGPLHGIPLAVKDFIDVAGHRTTAGAHPGFHPPPARADAEVVARLRAAGAIILGKTSTNEWGLGVSTNNAHFGPTRNPHDVTRIPGGSSGGSGAALAAGLCVGALGTDTGGSIRIPASLCGVVGLKPTFGLVSTLGVTPFSPSIDHVGPMARSAEDTFLLLEAISDFRRVPTRRPRVLVPENFFFDDVEQEVADLVRAAGARLGRPEVVRLEGVEAGPDAFRTMAISEAATFLEERLKRHPDRFAEDAAERIRIGLSCKATDYYRAQEFQRRWRSFLSRLLGDDAILVAPATPCPAPPIAESEGVVKSLALSRKLVRLTSPFSFAGVPVLCVPCGKVGGLPVGMQMVAAPHQESLLWAALA